MRPLCALALISLASLSGCSLLHSNIKGGFACAAPQGTCAPSTAIDDAALKAIERGAGQGTRVAEGTNTAGADASSAPAPANAQNREWVYVDGRRPALRILYPAWRDAMGHIHPRTTAYTSVDAPRPPAGDATPLDAGKLGAAQDSSLLTIAEMAPDAGLLAGPAASPAVSPAVAVPPTAVAPANSPIETIKDKVRAILSTAPKSTTVSPAPSATTAPSPAKPVASFPPKGN